MQTTDFSTLTDAQIAQFQRDGYLIVGNLISTEEATFLSDQFTDFASHGPVEGWSDMAAANACAPSEPLAKWPRIMHPHRHMDSPLGELSRRYLLDGRVESVLKGIMDDEPLAAQTMFYFKPAGARGQDLHQDNFYLRVTPDTCYAAWIALDDADEENGGMVVVPGSGAMEVVCPESNGDDSRFFTNVRVTPRTGQQEIPITMKAGDCLFFNGSLIHGSYPNTSKDRFRRAFISHYVPKQSSEVANWYDRITFRGDRVEIPNAVGGGACGDPSVMGPH